MSHTLSELVTARLLAQGAMTLLVKASAIVGLAWLGVLVLRTASAATKYAVWSLGFFGLVLLPVFELSLPTWTVPTTTAPAPVPMPEQSPVPQAATKTVAIPAPSGPVPSTVLPGNLVNLGHGFEPAGDNSMFSTRGPAPVSPMFLALALIWAGVAAALVARLVLGALAVTGLSRDAGTASTQVQALADNLGAGLGIRRGVRVLLCDRAEVPVTWGILRPVILLPQESRAWPRARVRAVLLHELAHVRRGDYVTHLVRQFANALYWPNPLVWLASRRAQLEQERACDDVALRSGFGSREYAGHLLDIARGYAVSGLRPTLAMAHPSTLETRVRAILSQRLNRGSLRPRTLVLTVIGAAAIGLPLASFSVWGESPEGAAIRRSTGELANPDPSIREHAVWSLGQLQARGAVKQIEARLDDSSPAVRGVAAWAMGHLHADRAQSSLSRALHDPDPYVREMAVLALGGIGDRDAVPLLVPLTLDSTAGVRSVTTHALGQLGGEQAAEALAQSALHDSDEHTRGMAVGMLGSLQEPASLPALVAALGDTSADLRRTAAYSLGRLGDPEAIVPLGDALRRDPAEQVRGGAAYALGRFTDLRAADALLPGLADSSFQVRVTVASSLGAVGGPVAGSALLGALRDPVHQVRLTASEALDSLGAKRHD